LNPLYCIYQSTQHIKFFLWIIPVYLPYVSLVLGFAVSPWENFCSPMIKWQCLSDLDPLDCFVRASPSHTPLRRDRMASVCKR
jgi:hypothetical protein